MNLNRKLSKNYQRVNLKPHLGTNEARALDKIPTKAWFIPVVRIGDFLFLAYVNEY